MSYLKDKLVYLSGAIEHCKEAVNWRPAVIKRLEEEFGLTVHDPFSSDKQLLTGKLQQARVNKDYETIREIARDFVSVDLKKVNKSEILIARVPPSVPTVGTCQEIVTAIANKTP